MQDNKIVIVNFEFSDPYMPTLDFYNNKNFQDLIDRMNPGYEVIGIKKYVNGHSKSSLEKTMRNSLTNHIDAESIKDSYAVLWAAHPLDYDWFGLLKKENYRGKKILLYNKNSERFKVNADFSVNEKASNAPFQALADFIVYGKTNVAERETDIEKFLIKMGPPGLEPGTFTV